MLHDDLKRLACEYVYERGKPFAGSDFGNFARHDLAISAKQQILFLPYSLKVKASVGAGNWAAVPWLAFFDPLITESATKGFYVVYLVNAQTEEIFLSLNQGTTAAYQTFGEKAGRKHLERTAIELAERIPKFAAHFSTQAIDLGSEDSLPQGYMAGHAFGRRYNAGNIPKDQFYSDLEIMLSAYDGLVELGGTIPTDLMMEEANSDDIIESRRYILSRRIERAPNVRLKVLEQRGTICEACKLDPSKHYNYSGPLKNTPLDVHHCKPISGMAEGESRRYKIPEDFLVLCPTCHRIIHKQRDEGDLNTLLRSLQFTHKLKVSR
jgi:5-methylcytosine-specific restriction enzyme A